MAHQNQARRCGGISLALGVMVVLATQCAAAVPPTLPLDVLPYKTVMMGVTSQVFSGTPQTNCTIATTMRFHEGVNAADVSVFVQFVSVSNESDVTSVYRRCEHEVYDITTNELGSVLRFHAAHDPLACLTAVLLELPVPDSFFPLNLSAVAHPYEPTKLIIFNLFDGWSLRLFPKMTFPELLRRSTDGPLVLDGDNAVAFCSAPSAFFGWSFRILFWGAYNVAMSATAITGSAFPGSDSQSNTDGSAASPVSVCSGDSYTRQAPLLFRLEGGRLDVVPPSVDPAAPGGPLDTLNATVGCVLGRSSEAYLFVVGTELWLVTDGTATPLTPSACWQTPAFAKVHAFDRLVGHTYAGAYGPLAAIRLTFLSVKSDGSTAIAQVTGAFSANEFTKDCDGEAPATVEFDVATGVANLYDFTTCLGEAVVIVGLSFWMRLQYINGADAFWVSTAAGSFLATRAAAPTP